jgi:MFS family permease
MTPAEMRGAAYGLRQSLDTAGALLGPLAAIGLMGLLDDDIRTVFWIAAIPAFAAVVVLIAGVKEPERHVDAASPHALPHRRQLGQLGQSFWIVTAIGALVTMARFSDAFLVLRANDAGLALAWTPLALVVMNAAYVATAYPAGRLSDRVNRLWPLVLGLAMLIVADIVMAVGQSAAAVLAGVAIWGLHMGLTQGVFAAVVADAAPSDLRGTAFGVFNFISGLAAFLSSLVAGGLWHWQGPSATFWAGAAFAAVALAGLLAWASVGERPRQTV